MMGIMKAKKKEIKLVNLADLGVSAADFPQKMTITKFSLPSSRKGGIKVSGEAAEAAKELARILREEAKVI
ncbi:MAG: electron transfer flavoprotein subunit beta, partial [Eubacteriales bacterium]|nr:electron transfer flavoprotein subunit beta [Eubacteriales bacterium]